MRARTALVAGALLATAAAGGTTLALRGPPPGAGVDIRFERARFARLPGALELDARADVQLPDAVRAGLDSGVPLEFVVTLDVREPHRLWPDSRRVRGRWHYRLEYYELTRHYRLGASDAGTSRNYRSLLRALEALGTLRGLTVAGAGTGTPYVEVEPGDVASLDMRLDTGALPLPLRPLVSSSWRVRSAPLAWRVGPPDADGA